MGLCSAMDWSDRQCYQRCSDHKHHKEVSVCANDHHWLVLCCITDWYGHSLDAWIADCLIQVSASSLLIFRGIFDQSLSVVWILKEKSWHTVGLIWLALFKVSRCAFGWMSFLLLWLHGGGTNITIKDNSCSHSIVSLNIPNVVLTKFCICG